MFKKKLLKLVLKNPLHQLFWVLLFSIFSLNIYMFCGLFNTYIFIQFLALQVHSSFFFKSKTQVIDSVR